MADLLGDYAGMDTAENDFPANTTTSGVLKTGWKEYGVISQSGDVDWFKVSLVGGEQYRLSIEANSTINGLFAPQLSLYSAAGTLIATATMGQGFQSQYLDYTPSATADCYVAASGPSSVTGNYILTVPVGVTGTSASTSTATVVGTAANDTLSGSSGNDNIDGGTGIDTVRYTGAYSGFSISKTSAGFTVKDNTGAEGTDTLVNLERLQFSDKKIALDLSSTGNAGKALEFIGALASSLVSDAGTVGTILSYFDQGYSMSALCQVAVDVGLVNRLAGSDSNLDLAKLVYRNVVGAEADVATANSLASYLQGNGGSYSKADFLATISGLDLNQTHIGLVGLQQTGVAYI